ncbi:hypothetical protein L596_011655 [Steinernema carpocapsae]|nr:hypothetical protein L596_011655 [Steinernema carpocapsae]
MWAHRSHSLPFAVLTVGQVIELNNFFCKSDDYVKFIGSPVNFRLEVNEDTTFTTNEALSAFWKNRFAVLTATQMNSTTFLTYHGL